jgi:uncharacterized membrane protein HdeD (DUF308 family)
MAAIGGPSADRLWYILRAIFGIGVGLATLVWPGITALTLVYLVAIWAVLSAIAEVVFGIALRKVIVGEWLSITAGVLMAILGIIIILNPREGAVAIVATVGVFSVLFGASIIGFGLSLRRVRGLAGQALPA